ncbi:MAG: hypothetical protein WCQ21_20070, partial [Verrucomicrobiota bacterium]
IDKINTVAGLEDTIPLGLQNFENGLLRLAAAPPGWLSIRSSAFGFLSACGLRSADLGFGMARTDFRAALP